MNLQKIQTCVNIIVNKNDAQTKTSSLSELHSQLDVLQYSFYSSGRILTAPLSAEAAIRA